MSFRLRIFLLVLVVAGTAIGATAWLTLSLTSRAVTRAEQAREKHQTEIVETIRGFGIRHADWAGVDRVVAELSTATRLHIRILATDDEVLADSDNLEGRAAGPVRLQPQTVEPYPLLDPLIRDRAHQLSVAVQRKVEATGRRELTPAMAKARAAKRPWESPGDPPRLPADLLGPIPVTGEFTRPVAQAYFQVVQYRTALATIRCAVKKQPALGLRDAPYLTEAQRAAAPACVRAATAKVRADGPWLESVWGQVHYCWTDDPDYAECLGSAFQMAASSTGAVPVKIYLGARQGTELDGLRRPAVAGAAALLVVAALGAAWVAR
ncbi:two-component sensor histidine kinase, partial [Actinoplanes sp. NPDC024001]